MKGGKKLFTVKEFSGGVLLKETSFVLLKGKLLRKDTVIVNEDEAKKAKVFSERNVLKEYWSNGNLRSETEGAEDDGKWVSKEYYPEGGLKRKLPLKTEKSMAFVNFMTGRDIWFQKFLMNII